MAVWNKFLSLIKYYWLAVLILLVLIAITLFSYNQVKETAYLRSESLFHERVSEAEGAVNRRLIDYIQILKGGKALFKASDTITRNDWNRYYTILEVEENYPGILGIGYSQVISAQELNVYEEKIRNEGFPDFSVYPKDSAREVYTSITYIEPFNQKNQEAFGYDMYSEPVRREAMRKAWVNGQPSLSDKVTLVQEITEYVQPGFLLYLPLYDAEEVPETEEERQRKILGFIYSPFRAYDLMSSILDNKFRRIDIEIYDSASLDEEGQIYDKNNGVGINNPDSGRFTKIVPFELGQNTWYFAFTSLPGFRADNKNNSEIILLSGFIISFLVFFALMFLSRVRKAQTEIVKTAQRVRFLSEAMPQKVWTANRYGKAEYFNQRWLDYTKMNSEELKEGWVDKIVHPDDKVRTHEIMTQAFRAGKGFHTEHRLRDAGGNYRWHLSRGVNQQDSKGRIIMWVGTEIDIHNQKRKTEELKKINSDLDTFIYTASHDLKAPISNLEGLLNTLRDEALDRSEQNQITELMSLSIQKFKETITDLTDISSIQKMAEGDVQQVKFSEVLDEVLKNLNFQVLESKAEIFSDFGIEQIHFSRNNLRSIFYNLISNSIKFRKKDTPLKIEIRTYRENEYIILSIKDNGIGIPSSKQEKVFSMFKRMHNHVGGSGVGLYILKRIVTNSGGKVKLISEENEGTEFRLYLIDQVHELNEGLE